MLDDELGLPLHFTCGQQKLVVIVLISEPYLISKVSEVVISCFFQLRITTSCVPLQTIASQTTDFNPGIILQTPPISDFCLKTHLHGNSTSGVSHSAEASVQEGHSKDVQKGNKVTISAVRQIVIAYALPNLPNHPATRKTKDFCSFTEPSWQTPP